MILSTPTTSTASSANNERQQINTDNKSVSPCSSPRSSPRPSPKPQTKRDHSKSDTLLSSNYQVNTNTTKEPSPTTKHDGSPSSQEGSVSSRVSGIFSTDNSPSPQGVQADVKSESGSSSKETKEKRDRTKKKSSWFNFIPTYKSKSEDFKRVFKDVPDDERLLVDYACALQKDILLQGRLYVTQNYLCFYANILGWETRQILKWKEVAAITKEKTALVIPNAVLICTKTDKFFFASFLSRDETYLMLFRFWQNALMDQPMTLQSLWQSVHQSYGAELGLTSDDEDYIPPGGIEEEKLSTRLSVESFSDNDSVLDIVAEQFNINSIMDERQEDDFKSNLATTTESSTKHNSADSHLATDATDNSESEGDKPISLKLKLPIIPHILRQHSSPSFLSNINSSKHPNTPDSDDSAFLRGAAKNCDSSPLIKCTSPHEGRTLLNEVFPIHIDQLFTLLYTSSKFYLDFHASRKTTDLTQTPWTHNPLDNTKHRVVNQTVALSQAMGPKTAQVTETQTMLSCSKAGSLYAIDIETINAGVPYADSFCIMLHACLTKLSDTRSSIAVYAQIKYKKSVWGLVKNMIERNCWPGLEDYYSKLKDSLLAEGEDNVPESKRKTRKKRRLHSIPRIEDHRISLPRRKVVQNNGIFNSDVCTVIVFTVLLLLLVINVMLYYKLWSLEDSPPYSLLDVQFLKNPPSSHEDWIKLLRQQESLHTVEAQKWQRILRTSVDLLRQAEESLNELQRSIHPSYVSKVMSAVKNENDNIQEEDNSNLNDPKQEL